MIVYKCHILFQVSSEWQQTVDVQSSPRRPTVLASQGRRLQQPTSTPFRRFLRRRRSRIVDDRTFSEDPQKRLRCHLTCKQCRFKYNRSQTTMTLR